ncbi:hypothetical protein [Bacillus sp. AK031]
MELTLVHILQLFLLAAATLFVSGLITFVLPGISLAVLLILSSMAGYIFTASNQLGELIIPISILNAALALTASWLVRYGQFIKKMAEKYQNATV